MVREKVKHTNIFANIASENIRLKFLNVLSVAKIQKPMNKESNI